MPDESHFRKLENMYHQAPCNSYYRPKLHIEEGAAELRLEVRPEFYHAAMALHGSVYFKILDDAAWFAVNSLVTGNFVLTVQFNTHLLRPVTEGTLLSKGRVIQASKSIYTAESIAYDAEGREIGRGSGSFLPGRQPLTPEIGYRL